MHLQKRNGHSVLYLSRETQSIRIPRDVPRKIDELPLTNKEIDDAQDERSTT